MSPEVSDSGWDILIVDDDPSTIILLNHLLRGSGTLRFANDAAGVFVQVDRAVPDLILLDMQLPDASGLTVCRQLRGQEETADVPVIFLTSSTREEDEIAGLEAGAVDFISKPPSGPILQARVSTHLRLKALTDSLKHSAAEDPLTGVANKRGLEEGLQSHWRRALAEGSPLSVLMIDIDHFKEYNDTHGHLAGDRCLVAVAQTLSRGCRSGDLIGRFGGDEFAVVLPGMDGSAAAALADRLVAAIGTNVESDLLPPVPQPSRSPPARPPILLPRT